MTQEEAKLTMFWQLCRLPRLPLAQEVAANIDGACARFYLLLSHGAPGVVITVQSGRIASSVEIIATQGTAVNFFPDYTVFSAKKDFPSAGDFLKRVRSLSDELSGDCVTNSRDGYMGIHVFADQKADWCFTMRNPDSLNDARYCALVNLYADTFLDGKRPLG